VLGVQQVHSLCFAAHSKKEQYSKKIDDEMESLLVRLFEGGTVEVSNDGKAAARKNNEDCPICFEETNGSTSSSGELPPAIPVEMTFTRHDFRVEEANQQLPALSFHAVH